MMAQYLSKKNKRRVSLIYIFLFLFIIGYSYNQNLEVKDDIAQSQINLVLSDYNLYLQSYSSNNKDFLIENPDYINNTDLVEEYSKSTPFYIDNKQKEISKYNLTIKFFKKNKRHSLSIENKIAQLNQNPYIYNFKNNSIELFGKVKKDGYVLIVKQLQKSTYIKEVLDNIILKMSIVGFINMLILFYLLTLFDEHEENKKQMYSQYEQLAEDAQAVAMKDKLTGAATRIKFDVVLEDLINIAYRFDDQKFTLMMLDIDNFKKVNDTYGHDYGDIVLKEVAKVVKEYIRESDTFARWGGEEFVILSPLVNLENSYIFANKIRESISNIKFEKIEQVTCSFGMVAYTKGDTEAGIMKRADELLYKAKHNGKNRVEY